MTYLESNVIQWAQSRGLLFEDNAKNQLLKTMSELGETADALLKGDHEGLKDGIGDVLVTLIILANTKGLDLETCLSAAWDEIKERKGTTINGTFIKS